MCNKVDQDNMSKVKLSSYQSQKPGSSRQSQQPSSSRQSQQPSSSRQAKKQNRDSADQSIKGKIHSVRVIDFVTYDSVLFKPGKYLNIVIGPNGTGKSTLVAAIILGMGGSPKVLSRSTSIQDYVKNGKETAQVYLTLYNQSDTDIVKFGRIFDLNGRSQWEIDGKPVSQKVYMQSIAEFNIQVDNLCQFLPQDRVQDFTKMNPQELLDNTQSSVCSPEIEEALRNLKELRSQQKNSGKVLNDNKKMLDEQVKRNEGLEAQIENIRQKMQLDKDLAICNKKLTWMQFEELFLKYRETEEDLKKAKENEKRAENEMRPLVERSKQIDHLKKGYETGINKRTAEYTSAQKELDTLDEMVDRLQLNLHEIKAELESTIAFDEERKRELEQAEQIQVALLRDVKDAIAAAGSETEKKNQLLSIEAKQNQCKSKNMEYLDKRRALNKALEEKFKPKLVANTTRISAMENTADRKLEVLRSKHDHAFRGVVWLRQNLHLFTGKVYEPMILELNVKDGNHAKYFENHISIRDLIAFTCERKEDVNLLGRKLRNEQKLNVNILHSDASASVQYQAHIPIDHIRKFGCLSYLIDLVDGPVPILNFLCRQYRIHAVPIGSQLLYDNSENMPKEISLFFTPNHRFSISVSKYTGERSSMCNEISGRQLLSVGIDTSALKALKAENESILKQTDQIKNERTRIEDEMRKIEQKNNELATERQRLMLKFNTVDSCKEKLQRHMHKMQDHQKNKIDIEEAKRKYGVQSKKLFERINGVNKSKLIAYKKYATAKLLYDGQREKFHIFKRCNIDMENQIREHQDAIERAKTYVTKITRVLEQDKAKCKEKQAEASRLTEGKKPSDGNKFPYRKQFDKLPDVMDELVEHMQQLQGRIDCMGIESTNIIEEFEQRKVQIENLRKLIANASNDTNRLETEMKAIHDMWYASILATVDIINNYFSTFMSSMGFSGEVELVHNEDVIRDYDQYGIQIRVKYRNEEKLQQLDRFIQSGGERAVAIAVYTLSLQHISHVPFRCVDEINQGMDPRNERKIFEMLVDQTAQPGKSQYFFVTPKLLPNLKYNDLIAVHIVHNGKFISNSEMFQ